MNAANTNTPATFAVGKTYWTRSICDSECIHRVTIARRSAKSVWIEKYDGRLVRRAIEIRDGVEQIWPHGRYSMAAIITADRCE